MANELQLTTVPFSDQRCVHTSRQDWLLCLTWIVFSSTEKHFWCQNNKKYIPVLWEVLVTHKYPDLRMSLNLTGQNRDNKHALHDAKLPSLLAISASIDQGLWPAVTYRNCTASNWGTDCQHNFFPISLVFCTTGSKRVCIWLPRESWR